MKICNNKKIVILLFIAIIIGIIGYMIYLNDKKETIIINNIIKHETNIKTNLSNAKLIIEKNNIPIKIYCPSDVENHFVFKQGDEGLGWHIALDSSISLSFIAENIDKDKILKFISCDISLYDDNNLRVHTENVGSISYEEIKPSKKENCNIMMHLNFLSYKELPPIKEIRLEFKDNSYWH